MSTTISIDKRIWIPAAGVALGVLGIVLALLLSARDEPRTARREKAQPAPSRAPSSPAQEAIPQADWRVTFTRAGKNGRLPKRALKRMRAQRPRLLATVRSAADAMFLGGSKPAVSYFRGPARGAFRSSKAGVPDGARDVRTLWRSARVAIQATTAKRAAAEVAVVARGAVDGRQFKVRHRSQLWLERTRKGWKVIAFDIDQRPAPLRGESKRSSKDKDR